MSALYGSRKVSPSPNGAVGPFSELLRTGLRSLWIVSLSFSAVAGRCNSAARHARR